MADVQWIKIKVGMFDGESFKKIKRAKIGGEKFRDKLTAIWFELMDFAGKCNHNGAFINAREIPYTSLEDIATMIDRETDELELCMAFFINEGMVEIINDVYLLSNWCEYQNTAGLDKIREDNRERQARFRERKKLKALQEASDNESNGESNVTERYSSYSYSKSNSNSKENKGECEGETTKSPYQVVYELYNGICLSYPKIRSFSEARKKAIKARLNTYTIDDFKLLFEKAEASSFLKGRNDRNWTASFDWLIKDANMAKVLDGNYDDRNNSRRSMANDDYGNPEDFYK